MSTGIIWGGLCQQAFETRHLKITYEGFRLLLGLIMHFEGEAFSIWQNGKFIVKKYKLKRIIFASTGAPVGV